MNRHEPPDRQKSEPAEGVAADVQHIDLIELLVFAYREFTAEPDEILARDGFGRAHHRVIHFVSRKPGLTVTELLEILAITKQSLSRVLRQLIDEEFVRQAAGDGDRRQRHLHLTKKGEELASRLMRLQSKRFHETLQSVEKSDGDALRRCLLAMLDDDNRRHFLALNGK